MSTDHALSGARSTELDRIRSAVAGLVTAFATDGYEMQIVEFDGVRLRMAIDAHEGACAECLVPASMMTGLIRTSLPKDLAEILIEIEYPARH